jgi:hypothetical protein
VVGVELSPTYIENPIHLRTASTQSFPHSIAHSAIYPLASPANSGLPSAITCPETSARRAHRSAFSSACSHWLSLDFL